jgi:putative phosphoribosyl transferase
MDERTLSPARRRNRRATASGRRKTACVSGLSASCCEGRGGWKGGRSDAAREATMDETSGTRETRVRVPARDVELDGDLAVPRTSRGVVLFAHGSGSSRHSSRNRYVAAQLQDAGLATLLMDLLTAEEEQLDLRTRHLRFDIRLLADRLVGAVDWLGRHPSTAHLPVGCFGASTGGGAALVAAAERPDTVRAVVSRGGRPDLAGGALPHVRAPTLLIVGGADEAVIGMNEDAMARMRCEVRLALVPGATHLFEEPGALEQVAAHARDWFLRVLSTEGGAEDQPC